MSWLKAVSVLALRVRGLLDTVRPTPPAGPAPLEHTALHGNKPSALHTNHQHLPVRLPQSLSSGHALSISTEQKLGSKTLSALLELLRQVRGSKPRIPAHQFLQPAKQALNHSSLPVLLTPAAQSSEQEPVSALTPTDNQSGNLGKSKTVASPTRQRAKPQRKTGRKAVSKTKVASKNSRAKAPAQTLTDSRFLVCGR
jgi:hypothetical protein